MLIYLEFDLFPCLSRNQALPILLKRHLSVSPLQECIQFRSSHFQI
jgi:hypothetical protein